MKIYACILMLSTVILYSAELDYNKSLNQFSATPIISVLESFRNVLLKYEAQYNKYVEQLNENDRKIATVIEKNSYWKQLHSSDISLNNMNILLDTIIKIKLKDQKYNKLTDRFLFDLIMQLYTSDNMYLTYYGMSYLNFFSEKFIEEKIDIILKVFENGKNISYFELTKIRLSDIIKKKYKSLFKEIIIKVKKQIPSLSETKIETKDLVIKINYLYLCAHLGDENSRKVLIDIFLKLNFADDPAVFKFMVDILLKLNTNDTIIAVLSRFRENVGAPSFYTGDSPRYYILSELYKLYSSDIFFQQYKNYLEASSIFSSPPYPADNNIGGEEGIMQLYNEFQKWAQERFQYTLQLQNSIPKINVKNSVRKYKIQ